MILSLYLRETETAIDNIVTAVMGGMASKALQQKLTQLEADKEELEKRIEEEKLEKPKTPEDFMRFLLHRFRKLDVTKESHRQMLIYTFVNAVFVHDDKLLLTFNFKDGTRTITLNDAKIAVKKNTGSNLDCLGGVFLNAMWKKLKYKPILVGMNGCLNYSNNPRPALRGALLLCPQKQCLSGKADELSGRTNQRLPPGGSSRRSRVRESALE